MDSFSYSGHALGTYARVPDGTGEFIDQMPTKGELNIVEEEKKPEYKLVLNEVNSSPDDWIEVMNLGTSTMDLSGYEIRDNSDDHRWKFPEGAVVEASGLFVVDANFTGKVYNDEIDTYVDGTGELIDFAIFTKGKLNLVTNPVVINEVQSNDKNGGINWIELANPTWGLYPDVNGDEYRNTKEETPGAVNKFNGIPEIINWPGQEKVTIYDKEPTFLEDASGLDFFNGQLYAVDNGTGKFWVLDVAEDGKLLFAKGFENGKRVRFQKDADNTIAAGPDAEGICKHGD